MRKRTKAKRQPKIKRSLIEKLTRAVCQAYRADKCSPSVILSHLPSGEFYASIVRYCDLYAKDKFRVISAKADTFDGAVVKVATEWMQNQHALDNLAASVRVREEIHEW
jgi:phenylpyruvate tautomerase PptA (4-oxalocrotonate tautomerase family)